jgi:CUB/sushi domain-containing protein
MQTCVEGEWSGEAPDCHFVDCKDPKPIHHGRYVLSSNTTFLTSAAIYECSPGWKLVGKARVLCGEDGNWSGEAHCQGTERNNIIKIHLNLDLHCTLRYHFAEITCEKLESDNILITKLRPGGVATYSCPRGSELFGNSTRTCLNNGEWSGAEPKCRGTYIR